MENARVKNLYVQYGCGFCAPKGWMNFDASPTLKFERIPLVGRLYTKNIRRFPENVHYGDIVAGLPLAADSCAGIFCSHVLEHLALESFERALRHTFSYLQPGGVFRLVVPDLAQLAHAYVSDTSESAAFRFMEASGLGRGKRSRGLIGFTKDWLGNTGHLWLWDEKAMESRLRQHGFKDIRRAAFGDSQDPRFKEVEDRERFQGCLAMQCRK